LCIVLVDNDSTDNSVQRIASKFPHIPILNTRQNLGFAGGNNIGIRWALDHGADFVLLSNNDVEVDKEAVTHLVSIADKDRTIGAVAPKILEFDNPCKISFAGGRISLWRGASYHVGQGEVDIGQYDRVNECDYLTGAFLLVRSEVIRQVGLISEDYFLYWEDADWCCRIRKHGYRLLYSPTASVWHKVSQGTGGFLNYGFNYYQIRNNLMFVRRFVPWYLRPSAYLFSLTRANRRMFGLVRRKLLGQTAIEWYLLRAFFHGVFDFVKQRTGQLQEKS